MLAHSKQRTASEQFYRFQFENFYNVNFSGRKLTWLHHLCHGELKITYLKKPYIITMQTYQMAIMLLFEGFDVMTCKEIQVGMSNMFRLLFAAMMNTLCYRKRSS